MRYENWEDSIKEAFDMESENITASAHLKDQIDREISRRKEGFSMRKFNSRKIAVVAACLCLLVPATIFAGGKITSYVSSDNPADYAKTKNWEDISRLEEKAEMKGDRVKELPGGYFFKEARVNGVEGKDDSGETVSRQRELDLTYENGSGRKLDVIMEKAIEEPEAATPDEVKKVGDISLKYNDDTYKFVPVGYKKTAEDKKLEAKGHYYISFGSDRIEMKNYRSVIWEKDGIRYMITGFDTGLSANDLFKMAQSILK